MRGIFLIGVIFVAVGCGDHCKDGVLNDDELGIDCGGATCGSCCNNKIKDATESDVDCGGASCTGCITAKSCGSGTDCASGTCTGGKCAPWTFSRLSTHFFELSCGFSTCHGETNPAAKLSLKNPTPNAVYTNVVNKAVNAATPPSLASKEGKIRVVPNDPAASFFLFKLKLAPTETAQDGTLFCHKEALAKETETSYGYCMPAGNPPAEAHYIDGVESWIKAGALNN